MLALFRSLIGQRFCLLCLDLFARISLCCIALYYMCMRVVVACWHESGEIDKWQLGHPSNDAYNIQCESKKSPPAVFWHYSPNAWEFLTNFSHTYYMILSTLFNYFQLWRSYSILSATT